MVEGIFTAFLALDLFSALLAAILAVFFLRSHSLFPDQAFGVLGTAFAVLAFSHLTTTVSGLQLYPERPIFDAVRTGGVFLSSLLIFLAYALRFRGRPIQNFRVIAFGTAFVASILILAYLVPGLGLLAPYEFFPWLRIVEGILLLTTALLVGRGVQATSLSDLRVAAGYLCLAFSRYTVGLLGLGRDFEPNLLGYAWRLVGLVLLALVVLPRWPRRAP